MKSSSVPKFSTMKECLENALKEANLEDKVIEKFLETGSSYYRNFSQVFVPKEVDSVNNYEYFELKGDTSANKAVLDFIIETYPLLRKGQNVSILSDLKQMIIETEFFSGFGKALSFDKFIAVGAPSIDLVEDVFEAFNGCLEEMVNDYFKSTGMPPEIQLGYPVVARFMRTQLSKLQWPSPSSDYLREFAILIRDWNPITALKETVENSNMKRCITMKSFKRPRDIEQELKSKKTYNPRGSIPEWDENPRNGYSEFLIYISMVPGCRDPKFNNFRDGFYGYARAKTEDKAKKIANLQVLKYLESIGIVVNKKFNAEL